MFASDTPFDEKSGLLRNEKRYKRDFEPSPLGQATASTPVNPEASDSEENPPVTPQRRSATPDIPSQSESQPGSSIPATGQSAPVNPPPKPSRNSMAHLVDDIKLPIFKGTGSEDPEQFWFLCEAVWNAKKITDPDVRAVQLITSFRDRALTWFMKFSRT